VVYDQQQCAWSAGGKYLLVLVVYVGVFCAGVV
jgi:hypothetical protein